MISNKKAIAVLACLIMATVPLMSACDCLSSEASSVTEIVIIYDGDSAHPQKIDTMATSTVVIPSKEKAGYTFNGWQFNGKVVKPGEYSTFELFTSMPGTYYFRSLFTANTYNAAFMDGETLISKKTCTFGSPIGDLPTASKPGYTLLGWSLSGKDTDIITSDTAYSIPGDATFRAVWKEATYTVSFFDGEKLCGTKTCVYKGTYGELPTASKPGYIFKGWAKDASGASIVTPDTMYTDTGDSKLYAVWVPMQFKITFIDNGVEIGTKTVDYNGAIGDMPTPTRKGHTFVGWSTDGTEGTLVNPETKFTQLQDMKLISVWKANTYKVTFVNGDTPVSSKDVVYGTAYGEMPSIESKGHTFVGWSTDGSVSKIVREQDIFTFDEDTKLFAVWDQKEYRISFVDDDHEIDNKTVKYGEKIGAMSTPTKIGKTFVGWSTDGTEGTIVHSDTAYMWDSDMTFHAVWSDKGYEITFVSEGSIIGTKHVNYGVEIGEMPVAESVGKKFVGWTSDPNTKEIVTPETKFAFDSDVTFFAVFEDIEYTVTFDSNGGTSTPEPIKLRYQQAFGTLPTVEKEGKRFLGWSTERDGKSMVTSETVLSQAGDITLYAVWGDEIASPDDGSEFDGILSMAAIVAGGLAAARVAFWIYKKGML